MECRSCTDTLTALLDDELSSEEKAVIEEHLAVCPRCGEELGTLRQATEMSGALSQLEPGPRLWHRIRADIEQPSPLGLFVSHLGRFLFRPWVPVTALAGLVAVILAVNSRDVAHPLETEFMSFIQERERVFDEQRRILFSSDAVYRYRQSRNPFIQSTAHLDRNPFQE
jgi:anti-sigma factor RsiW